jgi:trimethylamine--corrinoid protein Co-methyltransferase
MPELADRKLREQWQQEGSSTIHQRALNKAFDILSSTNPAALEPDVDARIRAEFDGLVAGDSVLPEGWNRFDVGGATAQRERRPSRRRGRKAS